MCGGTPSPSPISGITAPPELFSPAVGAPYESLSPSSSTSGSSFTARGSEPGRGSAGSGAGDWWSTLRGRFGVSSAWSAETGGGVSGLLEGGAAAMGGGGGGGGGWGAGRCRGGSGDNRGGGGAGADGVEGFDFLGG